MLQSTITDQDEFMSLMDMNGDNFHQGSLLQTRTDSSKLHSYYKNATCGSHDKIDTTERHLNSSLSAKYERLFSSEEVRWLHSLYKTLYPSALHSLGSWKYFMKLTYLVNNSYQ